MQTSESIKELTAALAKAQGEFDAVSKTGHNPFLKNTYATLDDIIGAIRGPLSKHGIAFMQPLTGNGEGFVLETVLMHESGEWLSCAANVPSNAGSKGTNELQSFGGALTYMRRYMLSALLGINAEEDTDGNGSKPQQAAKKPAAKVEPKAAPKDRMHQAMADAIAPEPAPHWIADDKVRVRFWAWATGDQENSLGLTNDQVHEALNVEHVADFPGTMGQAKELIEAWVKAATELVIEVPA